MTDFFRKDKLFGDFSSQPDAVRAWDDMLFLFTDVMPALDLNAAEFNACVSLFGDTTTKFLVKLFHENQDNNWLSVYGTAVLHDTVAEFDDGITGFFKLHDTDHVLGGHANFIERALFDLLSNITHEYPHRASAQNKEAAESEFFEKFEPFAERYKKYLTKQASFPTTNLAAYYASYEAIDEEYQSWQEEGLQRFAKLYVQNHKFFEFLKARDAKLSSKGWMETIAQDFNRYDEILKCKLEFCQLVENLLSQAFDIDIIPHSMENLEGSLAVLAAEPDGSMRFIYDRDYLQKAGLNHILNVIMHEFCHALQKIELNHMDWEATFEDRNPRERMTYFFQQIMYRQPDQNELLYTKNIQERDANAFAEKGMEILARLQLEDDVERALGLSV